MIKCYILPKQFLSCQQDADTIQSMMHDKLREAGFIRWWDDRKIGTRVYKCEERPEDIKVLGLSWEVIEEDDSDG